MTEKIFQRKIIFSHIPLEGYFRYKNILQMFPLEHNGDLELAGCYRHHPIILEYFFDTQDKELMPVCVGSQLKTPIPTLVTNSYIGDKKFKEILMLLLVFTNHRFFNYGGEQAWFVSLAAEDFPRKSDWGQKMYIQPRFENIKGFSNIEGLSEVKKKNSGHYSEPSMVSAGSESSIIFPDFIENLFDKYFQLDNEGKNFFDSASILFCNGGDLFGKMNSLSFAAFVSSIETLVECNRNLEKTKIKKCNNCGQNEYQSTKKFVDFIKKYGRISKEDTESEKYMKDIYDIRSKILHNGILLLGDYPHHPWYSESDSKKLKEEMMHRYFGQVVRICLVNWLSGYNQALV